MRRLVPVLLLAACEPPDPAEVCPEHVAALADCYERAEVPVPEGRTVDDLCPDDDLLGGDVYVCLTEAWTAGDCATEQGLVAISVALERCIL